MSAATPIAKAINPQRFIQTESGGFVDIGVIYLGADGAVEVLEWSKDLGRANFIDRSEEHTSELQSLLRNSYAVFCLKNKNDDVPAESGCRTKTETIPGQ